MTGTVRLRGRAREIETVQRQIGALTRRRGGVLVIEGPRGSGRSSLLEVAAATAAAAGVPVFRAGCDRRARLMPMNPLVEALLTGPDPVLEPSTVRELMALPEPRAWIAQTVEEHLARRAAEGPIAIALDDVEDADDVTLLALRTLPERLAAAPILWTITVRPPHAHRTRHQLESAGATVIRLEPLTEPAVVQLVEDVVGAPPGGALRDLAREAGGWPGWLIELTRGLRDAGHVQVQDGRADLRTPVSPLSFRDLVAGRLDDLSDAAREVLRLAAVLGPDCTAEHLGLLMRRPEATLLAPLQEALASELIAEDGNGIRFRSALLRQAVADTLSEPMLRALRRHIIATLQKHPASLREIAPVVLEVAHRDEPGSMDLLLRVADELAFAAPATSAEHDLRALELMAPEDPRRAAATVRAVTALHRCGRGREAVGLTRRLVAAEPEAEARVRLTIAEACAEAAPAAAAAECRRTLELHGMTAAQRRRARSLLVAALMAAGEWDELGELPGNDEPARVAGQRIEEALQRSPAPDGLWAVWLRVAAGRVTEVLDVPADEAGDARTVLWRATRARAALAAGRLAQARADAEAAARSFDDIEAGLPLTRHAWEVLAAVAAHAGDGLLAARSRAAADLMTAAHEPAVRRAGAWMSARLAFAAGRIEAAVTVAAPLVDELARGRPGLCWPYPPWELLALARLLGGSETVAAEALRRAALNSGLPAFAAVAAHARALADGDPGALAASAESIAGIAGAVVAAEAAEDAARAAGADPQHARVMLETALRRFDAAGADADARRVRALLGRPPGHAVAAAAPPHVAGWEELTNAELAVVRVVARGATNRTAAEELFLSPHTVSSHLRRAFRKLGIRSRVELAGIYARRAEAGLEEPLQA